MIIRKMKSEEIEEVAELRYDYAKYRRARMENRPVEFTVEDEIKALEEDIALKRDIIVAIENHKIIDAILMSILDNCILINFMARLINTQARNELLKKIEQIKQEKNFKTIYNISYYGLEENPILEKRGYICESITFLCELQEDIKIQENDCITRINGTNKQKVLDFIKEEDIEDNKKIILLYEKNTSKELLVAGINNNKEIQIFTRPVIKNKEVEKQLIRQLQKIAIERNIRNLVALELERDNKRENLLFELGFQPCQMYFYK